MQLSLFESVELCPRSSKAISPVWCRLAAPDLRWGQVTERCWGDGPTVGLAIAGAMFRVLFDDGSFGWFADECITWKVSREGGAA